jgi:SAM-dependent methyltransferase
MPVDDIFGEPRLAAIYDAVNPPNPDDAFFLGLADGLGSLRVLDVGCGTGRLAVAFADAGHRVTGVDPAAAMLEVARARDPHGSVRWVHGEIGAINEDEVFDLIVMNGHVFQVFLTDDAVAALLGAARRLLGPGGRLAFETREPRATEWEKWNAADSAERIDVTGEGPVDAEWDVTEVDLPLVTFETRYTFVASGERLVAPSTLRFWDRDDVAAHLEAAGFTEVEWLGDHDGSPHTPESREIIAIAS